MVSRRLLLALVMALVLMLVLVLVFVFVLVLRVLLLRARCENEGCVPISLPWTRCRRLHQVAGRTATAHSSSSWVPMARGSVGKSQSLAGSSRAGTPQS